MVLLQPNQGPKYKLLQDWAPYNESVIWDIANKYYKNKGVQAFSRNNGNKAVPHNINTNYVNAKAFAELVKANLINYPQDYRLQILECGAGSGYFSMNFLHAARDIGILNRVKLLISDYTTVNLKEIQGLKMLEGFTLGEDYEFIKLDLLNPQAAEDLSGKAFPLKNISAVILNYVLDALPLTVLCKTRNNSFEELQLKIEESHTSIHDALNNPNLMTDLIKSERWINYQIQLESDLEVKYFNTFQEFYQNANPERYIPYPYIAIHACQQLLLSLDDHGFIFSCDISPLESTYCQIVGNALAHEIDIELLATYFSKQDIETKVHIESLVSRLILTKNKSVLPSLEASFQEHYITNNLVHRYIDLREVLIKFQYKESADIMKLVLEEFDKLAKNSPYPGIYWGNYYGILGDTVKAIEAYKQARKYDYIKSYNLDLIIENLEKKLARESK